MLRVAGVWERVKKGRRNREGVMGLGLRLEGGGGTK
jgi:hypothetical protein